MTEVMMKKQLKGIALILLGILFALAAISLNYAEFTLIGGALGIVGTVMAFLDDSKKNITK